MFRNRWIWWLHNTVNVRNATQLLTKMANFRSIKKKKKTWSKPYYSTCQFQTPTVILRTHSIPPSRFWLHALHLCCVSTCFRTFALALAPAWRSFPRFSHLTPFPDGSAGKNPSAIHETQGTQVQSLGQEDPLEEEMTIHSSILAWRIPWAEVGYSPWGRKEWDNDWVTKQPPPDLIRNRRYSLNTFNHFEIISYLVDKCQPINPSIYRKWIRNEGIAWDLYSSKSLIRIFIFFFFPQEAHYFIYSPTVLYVHLWAVQKHFFF